MCPKQEQFKSEVFHMLSHWWRVGTGPVDRALSNTIPKIRLQTKDGLMDSRRIHSQTSQQVSRRHFVGLISPPGTLKWRSLVPPSRILIILILI